MNLSGKPEKVKSRVIIEYVKANFTWDGNYSKYASQSAKDFFSTKTGNSADINLFLVALLNNAGIVTDPMILSIRDHGKVKTDYPFDHFTNYVVALVYTNSAFMADGTQKLLPYNKIPPKCMNEQGLIVTDDEEVQWLMTNGNLPYISKKCDLDFSYMILMYTPGLRVR